MRRLLTLAAVVSCVLSVPSPAQASPTVTWTADDKGNFGYVALICHTADGEFYGSKMKLPATGTTNIGYDTDNRIVWNYGNPYFTYSGPVTCEGRVISKSEKRLVGYTTPRLFTVTV